MRKVKFTGIQWFTQSHGLHMSWPVVQNHTTSSTLSSTFYYIEHWWWNTWFSNFLTLKLFCWEGAREQLIKVLRIWAVPRSLPKYLQFILSLSYIQRMLFQEGLWWDIFSQLVLHVCHTPQTLWAALGNIPCSSQFCATLLWPRKLSIYFSCTLVCRLARATLLQFEFGSALCGSSSEGREKGQWLSKVCSSHGGFTREAKQSHAI